MRSIFLALTLFLACVAAINSGIFEDDGSSITQAPGTEDAAVGRRAENFIPTPTRRVTNAERLRRGLPLMPPSRRSSPLAPRASCLPLSSGRGIVRVTKSGGGVLGYIRKTFDGQNSYTFGPETEALIVQLSSTQDNAGWIEFTAVNGPDPSHPFVGAVGGSGGYNFNPGQVGYAYLAGTGHTPANSPPSFTAGHSIQVLGYNAPAESTVWNVNCFTGAITAQWTNVDGSQPSTSVFYDPSVDFLALVGDFNKFVATFPGEGAILVTLTFVPIP